MNVQWIMIMKCPFNKGPLFHECEKCIELCKPEVLCFFVHKFASQCCSVIVLFSVCEYLHLAHFYLPGEHLARPAFEHCLLCG